MLEGQLTRGGAWRILDPPGFKEYAYEKIPKGIILQRSDGNTAALLRELKKELQGNQEQAQNLGRWLNSDETSPPMTCCGFQK